MDRGNLGERVRAVRKARDLSQEALAREAGVSLNLVNKLERGVSPIHTTRLCQGSRVR